MDVVKATNPFDNLRVVMVNTRNSLNLGAAARAMSNFGASHLHVVNPYEHSFREAVSAVGASDILAEAKVHTSVAEAVADCSLVIGTTAGVGSKRELHHPLKKLDEGTKTIRKRLRSGRVAVLFGSEKRGLSNDDLSHCHWLMHIPTHEKNYSMNLGQAVAVCLYELARASKAKGSKLREQTANAVELERLTAILVECLTTSGFIKLTSKGEPIPLSVEKARRLIRRMKLSSADAELWMGMLNKMIWKMKQV
jgi:TrmH family RNA methyltransferase